MNEIKEKFMPGPWEVIPADEANRRITISAKRAKKYSSLGPIAIVCKRRKSSRANAALIAAAPDMYFMLKSILDDCEICTACAHYPGDITPRQQIEAVLKKARGEK